VAFFSDIAGDKTSKFKPCHLLNISQCEVSEQAEQFVLTLYNPLSRPVTEFVRLPVPSERAYDVIDPDGRSLATQYVPLPDAVSRIPGRKSLATVELVFRANDLPPLGYKSYLITKVENYLKPLRLGNSRTERNDGTIDIGDEVRTWLYLL